MFVVLEILSEVQGQVVTLLEVLPITLIFSFILSLPTLIFAVLFNKFSGIKKVSDAVQKVSNVLIATVGLISTFFILEGGLTPPLIVTYVIAVAVSAILLELFTLLEYRSSSHK